MTSLGEGGDGQPQREKQLTSEQLAAIHAAMMEELGFARKDTLPLENKKGGRGQVDLNALDREKKAKDPRTMEFKIAQKNATAHSAWKNAIFDDVDEADLEIDGMNDGQSHRQRLKAELESTSASRGVHAHRGGRGGSSFRGGASHSIPRPTKKEPIVNIQQVLARLRAAPDRAGQASHATKISTRGGLAVFARHGIDIPGPVPNLSFHDRRSVDALPIDENIANNGQPRGGKGNKVQRPARYPTANHRFALASPEEFLEGSWSSKSTTKSSNDNGKVKLPQNTLHPQYATPQSASNKDPEVQPPARPVGVQSPPTHPHSRIAVDTSRVVLHETKVKVDNDIEQHVVPLGVGTIRIVSIASNGQTSVLVEVEVHGKIVFAQPLVESLQYRVESCVMYFDSDIGGRYIKWILKTQLPWTAKNLEEALERHKPQLRSKPLGASPLEEPSINRPTETNHCSEYMSDLPSVGDVETLISFSEETPQQEFASNFTQDLLCLMDDQAVDETLEAINCGPSGPLLDQVSTMMAASEPIGEPVLVNKVTNTEKPRSVIRGGLATSRYAAAEVVVGRFLSKSSIFKSLPEDAATLYRQEVSRRVLNRAQHTDQPGPVSTAPQQPHISYTIEEMMKYRSQASPIIKPLLLDEWIGSSAGNRSRFSSSESSAGIVPLKLQSRGPSESSARNNIHTTSLSIQIVADVQKTSSFQGLASSKYASALTSKIVKARAPRLIPQTSSAKSAVFPSSSMTDDKEARRQHDMPIQVIPLAQETATNPPKFPTTPMGDKIGRNVLVDVEEPSVFQGLASSKYASKPASKEVKEIAMPMMPLTRQSTTEPLCFPTAYMSDGMGQNDATKAAPSAGKVIGAVNGFCSMTAPTYSKNTNSEVVTPQSLTACTESDYLHSLAVGSLDNLKRRSSLDSHTSRDSAETMKPSMPGRIINAAQSSLPTAFRHRLSVDSNTSLDSFATAAKGNSFQEKGDKAIVAVSEYQKSIEMQRATTTQMSTSISVMQTIDAGQSQAAQANPHVVSRSIYSPEQKHDSVVEISQSATPDIAPVTLLTAFKSSDVPTPTSVLKGRQGGLMSSRFATDARGNSFPDPKPKVRPISSIVQMHLNSEQGKQAVVPKPLVNDPGDLGNNCRKGFTPTASSFAPTKTDIHSPSTGHEFTLPMTTFSSPIEPILSTVLVPDPLIPGHYKEVQGFLKVGSIPLVAHIRAPLPQAHASSSFDFGVPDFQSPYDHMGGSPTSVTAGNSFAFRPAIDSTHTKRMDENLKQGGLLGNKLSRPPVPSTNARTPLVPTHKVNNDSIENVQQDVQQRLKQSLARRRS